MQENMKEYFSEKEARERRLAIYTEKIQETVLNKSAETIRSLVDERHNQKMTQQEISDITGIKPSNLARFESGGRVPTLIVLEKYANALGKHIEIKICDDWQIFIQRIINDNIKHNNIKGGTIIARKLRVWFPGATYHIMHRGVRRKPIFEDERDYQVFLQILKTALTKYRCVLHAYCLMTNHIHLILETCDMEIGKFMKHASTPVAIQ